MLGPDQRKDVIFSLTFWLQMVYNLSMKKINPEDIPKELYLAFSRCHYNGFVDEEIHGEFEKLSTEFLGTEDSLEHSRLVVILTKMLMEIEGDWR